jgi:hypothetical protein
MIAGCLEVLTIGPAKALGTNLSRSRLISVLRGVADA